MLRYISHNYPDTAGAATKAGSDVEAVMRDMGMVNAGFERTVGLSGPRAAIRDAVAVRRAVSTLEPGDILFLQYPLQRHWRSVVKGAHSRGARVVALVHDLPSRRHGDHTDARAELRRLRDADYVIATNDVMARQLRAEGLHCPMGTLGLWDYLTPAEPLTSSISDGKWHVAFAGDLENGNNGFIYQWGRVAADLYRIDLYGRGFRMDLAENPGAFYYHGQHHPDKIIDGMTSDFGLVWEARGLEAPDATAEPYLAINTPHKLSLYLRAGLPVIIWSGAAMAPFVRDENVGLAVDTLAEIGPRLAALSDDEMRTMRSNAARLAQRIARGDNFREAARRAISRLR